MDGTSEGARTMSASTPAPSTPTITRSSPRPEVPPEVPGVATTAAAFAVTTAGLRLAAARAFETLADTGSRKEAVIAADGTAGACKEALMNFFRGAAGLAAGAGRAVVVAGRVEGEVTTGAGDRSTAAPAATVPRSACARRNTRVSALG